MAFAWAPAISSPPIQLFNKKRRLESNTGAAFGIANKSPLLRNKRVVVTSHIAVPGQVRPQHIARQTLANLSSPCISPPNWPLSRERSQKQARRGFGNNSKPGTGKRVSPLEALSLSEATVEVLDPSEFLPAETLNFEDESGATMLSKEKSNVGWSQGSAAQSAAPESCLQKNVGQKAEDKKAESWVPRRLGEAAVHFLKQPSVLLSLAAIAAVAAVRARFPWRLADGPGKVQTTRLGEGLCASIS